MNYYLAPSIPELKIKDYEVYQAFRCGICSQLMENYGIFIQIGRASQLILIALLADGLAGREATVCHGRCPRHPFRRHAMMCHTQGIRLAAQLNVITTYHIYADAPTFSIWDKVKKAFCTRVFQSAFQKAQAQAMVIERLLQQEKAQQQVLELSKNKSYEEAYKPMANMMGAYLVYCAPDESAVNALRRTGYALGKLLYLYQSIERYAFAKKHGLYNIFLENGLSYEAAVENAKYQCGLAAAEIANAYNLLNMKVYRSLADNIIFNGLEQSIQHLGDPAWKQVTRWENS